MSRRDDSAGTLSPSAMTPEQAARVLAAVGARYASLENGKTHGMPCACLVGRLARPPRRAANLQPGWHRLPLLAAERLTEVSREFGPCET